MTCSHEILPAPVSAELHFPNKSNSCSPFGLANCRYATSALYLALHRLETRILKPAPRLSGSVLFSSLPSQSPDNAAYNPNLRTDVPPHRPLRAFRHRQVHPRQAPHVRP